MKKVDELEVMRSKFKAVLVKVNDLEQEYAQKNKFLESERQVLGDPKGRFIDINKISQDAMRWGVFHRDYSKQIRIRSKAEYDVYMGNVYAGRLEVENKISEEFRNK